MWDLREGRYSGTLTGDGEFDGENDVVLRISRHPDRKLLHASGDVARHGAHRFSFSLENPAIEDLGGGRFKGRVKIIGRAPASTNIRVVPAPDKSSAAAVHMQLAGSAMQGNLAYAGTALRTLKVDVEGLEGGPVLDPTLLSGEAGSAINLKTALAGAGIDAQVEFHPAPAERANGAPGADRSSITLAELDAHLEHFLNAHPDPGSEMRVHMLLCGRLAGEQGAGKVGIMYDTRNFDGMTGGADPLVQRRGVAIFLESELLKTDGGEPPVHRDDIVFAMVHEIGHALNLPHSWERDASAGWNDLTWMNNPYEFREGPNIFWDGFRTKECFHKQELRFLHHAPYPDITPGQSRYGERSSKILSGGVNPFLAADLPARARLSIRPLKPHYVFGEPVFLSVTVENMGPGRLDVLKALDPSDGYLKIAIRKPSGRSFEFRSPAHLCGGARIRRLKPGQAMQFDGVLLSHSIDGCCFDEAGRYEIEAEFSGLPTGSVCTATGLRLLHPSREEELFAIALWDDQRMARTLWLRHPLAAQDRWNALVEDMAHLIPRDPANTTASYLRYIAALGWMTPHSAPGGRTYARDRKRARAHLANVNPAGLPAGVANRMRRLRVKASSSVQPV